MKFNDIVIVDSYWPANKYGVIINTSANICCVLGVQSRWFEMFNLKEYITY